MNDNEFRSWLKSPSRTLIMGILNLTPDSFSDGGQFNSIQKALDYTMSMIEAGADIIDIGGESTRPGSKPISFVEEIERTIPVIEEIRKISDCTISIDSYKSEVVEAALNVNANIVNDISGLTYDNKMAKLISDNKAPLILMHMKGKPLDMQKNPIYDDLISEICNFFSNQISFANSVGIDSSKIILDPGIGFGKRIEDNFEIIRELKQIRAMGFPVLIGPSRKSFIGDTLNLPTDDRIEGTMATITAGLLNGANIVRVHDINETLRTVSIAERIKGVL